MHSKDDEVSRVLHEFLQTSKGAYSRVCVRKFHKWLQDEGEELFTISQQLVHKYLEHTTQRLKPRTACVYKCMLLGYLDFLYDRKKISFDPELLRVRPEPIPLPEPARPSVQLRPYASTHVRQFHNWLEDQAISLEGLSTQLVGEYFNQRLKKISSATAVVDRAQVLAYLDFFTPDIVYRLILKFCGSRSTPILYQNPLVFFLSLLRVNMARVSRENSINGWLNATPLCRS